MRRPGRLHLLLPAFHAAASVGGVLARVAPFRARLARVWVVDDGSADGTADVARRAGAQVLVHPTNRGKGAALRTGFAAALGAGADAVITMDADNQHFPEDLPVFFSAWDRDFADIALGSRRGEVALIPRGRWIGNRFSTLVGAGYTGYEMDDLQCGFRLYTAEVLRAVPTRMGGFAAESEAIIRSHRLGFRVRNVPVRVLYDPRATSPSHYRLFRDSVRVFQVVPHSLFWR